ncbi:sigma-70 family RNA polymerase sigma factor [Mycolicibacterium baixiangningiae]|nr:sigma-70 family RNA polymerase sigma factor [Mycolicibacterium baixiangningiae]
MTGNRHDAEDLVQETLAKAFTRYDRYCEENKLRAWLFRIMFTTWIDTYRAGRSRPTEVLTGEFSDGQIAGRHPQRILRLCSAEDQVLDALPDDDTADALRRLPQNFRAVVYLADVHGYPIAEIAGLLGTPIGTVSSRLHRGRAKLRLLLADTAGTRGFDIPA